MSIGGSTITITVNAVDKILNRIGHPPGSDFGSQYYLREATQEFTLNVRHSKEKPLRDSRQFDHHNVELINTVFATDTTPSYTRVSYAVFRNLRDDDYDGVEDISVALLDLLKDTGNVSQLLGWVS